jgi:phage terminase Nu1 subunit (DNA packaging protein)
MSAKKSPAKKAAKTAPAPPKPAAPKAAQADTTQLCRLFNLTSARIGQLAKDGIIFKTERNQYDLWRSVRGYIEFLQKSKTEGASHMERSGTTGDPQELEELVRQVKAARTYNDARTLKVQIDALRAGYALEVEQERYCSIAQIEDGMDGIAAVVRNAIKRMEADLPPMLEGLEASAMKRLIAEKSAQVIQIIYDEGERIKAPISGEIPSH